MRNNTSFFCLFFTPVDKLSILVSWSWQWQVSPWGSFGQVVKSLKSRLKILPTRQALNIASAGTDQMASNSLHCQIPEERNTHEKKVRAPLLKEASLTFFLNLFFDPTKDFQDQDLNNSCWCLYFQLGRVSSYQSRASMTEVSRALTDMKSELKSRSEQLKFGAQ